MHHPHSLPQTYTRFKETRPKSKQIGRFHVTPSYMLNEDTPSSTRKIGRFSVRSVNPNN